MGKPLEEEKELYAKAVITEKGAKIFKLGDNSKREYTEDAVGEEFVFEITKGFLGYKLNDPELDDLMFKTPFYRYKKITK